MEEELDLSTPVEGEITSEGSAGGPVVGAEPTAEPSAEKESTTVWENPDVAVRQNLNANNEATTSTMQETYAETVGFAQHDENREPVSAHARNEKEAKAREDADEKLGRLQQESEERAERQRAAEARSLAHLERMGLDDLQRLSAQLGNPEMQAKVEARLSRNGMSKERIEKGKSEMKEYLDLRMKQEKEGKDKLTETEQQRLKGIKESQEFKAYSVEANNTYNVDLKASIAENKAKERSMENLRQVAGDNVDGMLADRISKLQGSSRDEMSKDESSRSAAYAHFSSARNVGDEFKDAASNDRTNKLSLKQENDAKVATAPRAVIAQIQADAAMI